MSKRVCVCLVCNTAWGILNFRANLIRFLVSRNVRVVAVAPNDPEVFDLLRRLGAECRSVSLDNRGANPLKEFQAFLDICRCYRELRPDLVVHYTIKPVIYGGWAAALTRVRSLAVVTGLGYAFINSGLKALVARNLYRTSLSSAQEVWFLNGSDRNLFVDLGLVDDQRCSVLPGEGVDTEYFSYSASKECAFQEDRHFVFLLVARLLYDKGLLEYAEASRLVRKRLHEMGSKLTFSFQLLGPPYPGNPQAVDSSELQAWIDSGDITYLGATADVRPYIKQCDALVLPSYGEGIPRTVLEAMSMGRPVIVSDVSGCRDLVSDRLQGLLCDARSASSLADVVMKFMHMTEEERTGMGIAGREKVNLLYSDSVVLASYQDFLSRVDIVV